MYEGNKMDHCIFCFQETPLQSVLKQLTVILKVKSGVLEWFMTGISAWTADTFFLFLWRIYSSLLLLKSNSSSGSNWYAEGNQRLLSEQTWILRESMLKEQGYTIPPCIQMI